MFRLCSAPRSSSKTRSGTTLYRGKVVLLNIMKTDCPHCGAFSKILGQAQKKYGDRLQVLSIVNSPPENQNSVRAYLGKNGLSMVVLFDCRQVTQLGARN